MKKINRILVEVSVQPRKSISVRLMLFIDPNGSFALNQRSTHSKGHAIPAYGRENTVVAIAKAGRIEDRR